MAQKLLREWKKVFVSDLAYIVYELKELTRTPCLIILEGPLGAGKTTFCQHFIGSEEVLSPSYSVISDCKDIVHGDFYRLEDTQEFLALELMTYLEGKQYFMAEWGSKFTKRLMRELPEGWNSYLLEISMGKNQTDGEDFRNFSLYSLSED